MKLTHNEVLNAVDEVNSPMLILDGRAHECLIHPDTDDDPYTMEDLSNGNIYIIDHDPDYGNKGSVTVLDWFEVKYA